MHVAFLLCLQEVDQLRRAGNLKSADGNYAAAVQIFSDALRLKPDATQLLINRALCLILTKDPEAAVRPHLTCGMAGPSNLVVL